MSDTNATMSKTTSNDKSVFYDFRNHANASRTETKSSVLEIIRNRYRSYHVTEVDAKKCNLFDFASADKAVLTFDGEEETFDTLRQWRSVGNGIEKKLSPGRLEDEYTFARFHCKWEDKNFIVYHLVYRDIFCAETRLFYILHPRQEGNITGGHCVETDALVLACGKWTSQLHDEIWVFDNGYWEKSKELYAAVAGSSWSDVILAPDMKKGLIEDVQGFFDNRELYGQYAVPWKRGIILHGVPGNGKTVSIKALINSLYQRPDHISSLYVKSFETKCDTMQYSIRAIFQQARRCAPCLLIFEDLDSLVDDNIRSYFLNEVDGLESNDGILMIGSTNHLDKLDPAIAKRPSRFDRKYHFRLPGEAERSLYAEYWRQKLLHKNPTLEFPEEVCEIVSKLTEGFSFAYLKELFVMSLLSLVRGFKGDDFEIVDPEEAESAPEDTPASSTPDEKDANESKADADVCTCKSKCADCGKPVADKASADASKKPANEPEEKSTDTKSSKLALASIEIPDHLADNILIKVIKHQIRVLHAEMDNTNTEEWPSGRKALNGQQSRASAATARAMARRQRAAMRAC